MLLSDVQIKNLTGMFKLAVCCSMMKQDPGSTILQYHTLFLNIQNAFKNCGACSGVGTGVVNWMATKIHGPGSMPDTIKEDKLLVIQASAEEQEAALIFLYGWGGQGQVCTSLGRASEHMSEWPEQFC